MIYKVVHRTTPATASFNDGINTFIHYLTFHDFRICGLNVFLEDFKHFFCHSTVWNKELSLTKLYNRLHQGVQRFRLSRICIHLKKADLLNVSVMVLCNAKIFRLIRNNQKNYAFLHFFIFFGMF